MVYRAPGIYVEEVPSGPRVISGASTSLLGLVGKFPRGDDKPIFVGSYQEFERVFGLPDYNFYGADEMVKASAYGVKLYFENGGSGAWVLRANAGGSVASANNFNWAVVATSAGSWGNKLKVTLRKISAGNFDVIVYYNNVVVERFVGVNFSDRGNPRFAESFVVSDYIKFVAMSGFVEPEDVDNEVEFVLAGGSDGELVFNESVLRKFDVVDDILILIVPMYDGEAYNPNMLAHLKSYLENNKWRFGIINLPRYDVSNLDSLRSTYIAFYVPTGYTVNPISGAVEVVSLSGALAGYYARNDSVRNVGKVPAGVGIGSLNNIISLKENYTQVAIENFYTKGINPVLNKVGYGIVPFGARLSSLDPQWTYINKRRLLQFVEKSIKDALAWVNFENNNAITRLQVKTQIENFLFRLFTLNYFAGTSPNEAYFVICDDTNNPPQAVNAGYLYVDVGIAINKPAEFVVLRFQEKVQG